MRIRWKDSNKLAGDKLEMEQNKLEKKQRKRGAMQDQEEDERDCQIGAGSKNKPSYVYSGNGPTTGNPQVRKASY